MGSQAACNFQSYVGIYWGCRGYNSASDRGVNYAYYLYIGAWYCSVSPNEMQSNGLVYIDIVDSDGKLNGTHVDNPRGGVLTSIFTFQNYVDVVRTCRGWSNNDDYSTLDVNYYLNKNSHSWVCSPCELSNYYKIVTMYKGMIYSNHWIQGDGGVL